MQLRKIESKTVFLDLGQYIFMNNEFYMHRCLQLAEMGLGKVSPNPLVGCVIVNDSKIIGEGYHEKYGEAHAEINAIKTVKNKALLSKSAIYVSLEPCSHYGKTPPCVDSIIQYKIPEVIIGIKDPFELVNGNGIQKLKDAGVKVTVGVLEKKSKWMNKRFLTFHTQKRPYIILKWAQSADKFIAPSHSQTEKRQADTIAFSKRANTKWISNEFSRILVHKWRTEEDAIMVGTNTARIDNPELNVRDYSGRNPVRILIDKDLSLSTDLNLFNQKYRTIVFSSKSKKSIYNLEYVKLNFNENVIQQLLEILYNKNIQSVIIEGGRYLLDEFLKQGLWDEARVFTSDCILTSGLEAPELNGQIKFKQQLANDTLKIYIK